MNHILDDQSDERFSTGVPNLDAVLNGGLVPGSVTVLAGPPGSGKTILSHQIGFHLATPESKVIFFQTMSEPTAKRLRFLKKFSYFDAEKLGNAVSFIDLAAPLKTDGVDAVLNTVMDHVRQLRPTLVVIDSYKAFGDYVSTSEETRNFSYELAVNLMAWECTVLLLGEYGMQEIGVNPLFSVIDSMFLMKQELVAGENRRLLQVFKMRGSAHSRDVHTFSINNDGIKLYTPMLDFKNYSIVSESGRKKERRQVGVSQIDALMAGGVPQGSTILVSGAAGTGKTLLLLEYIYRGAKEFREKGLYFSFEESAERLYAVAKSFGWDIEGEVKKGTLKIIFISQLQIRIEEHLAMIRDEITAFGAERIAVDSLSVFFDKLANAQDIRDKVFRLTTIIQGAGAVGFFASNLPYGIDNVSRYGVEETVVDGVIILSSVLQGLKRERFIEIYKLRNSRHVLGRHVMEIGEQGITVVPSHLPVARGVRAKKKAVKAKSSRKKR